MGILNRKPKKAEDAGQAATPHVDATQKKTASVAPGVKQAKRVLLGAHVSEKAAGDEATGTYIFRVTLDATKGDIKEAIRAHYGATPVSVRVINVEGKRVRFGRSMGKRSDWKKAIVTLPKDTHIDIHSGV